MTTRGSKTKSSIQEDLLVGRKPEMALISNRLEEARTGIGCFVAISGEPGIGKTRLAQAAVAAALKMGFKAFWSQCHDGQYIPPYWPWKQLLRDLVKLLSQRGSPQSKAIIAALSEITTGEPQKLEKQPGLETSIPEKTRLKILESTTLLLQNVSKANPILLILDNLHCADVPSLQLLQVVSSETSGHAVMIVGSYREPSGTTTNALREAIGALAGQSFFESIPLSGWDLSGVEECLTLFGVEKPPAQLAKAIHERTNGNPLFVLEVARLLHHKGMFDSLSASRSWDNLIPQKVRLATLGLFERLTPRCRLALSAAALVGREFEVSFLREVLGDEGSQIESLLEEALSYGLIQEVETGLGVFRFVHAIVQSVIAEELPVLQRPSLHLKIAEALEPRIGDDPKAYGGTLARHFEAAGQDFAEKATQYYQIAGENALRMCAYEDASEQFTRAINLGKGKNPPSEMAKLLFGIAQSLHGLGNVIEAADYHSKAFTMFVQSRQTEDAVRIFEQPLILMEKPAKLTKLLEKAISFVGPNSLRGEALGSKYALAVYHDTGDYARAFSIFTKALDSAVASGDVQQQMGALANWGRVEGDELHFERALEIEREVTGLAIQNGNLWMEAIGHTASVVALLGLGRVDEAEKQTKMLHALADRAQTRLWKTISSLMASSILRQKGELESARKVINDSLLVGQATYLTWNRALQTLLDFETGETLQAGTLLQEVIDQADQTSFSFQWEGLLALLIPSISWITRQPLPLAEAETAARKVPLFGGLRRGDAVTVSVGLGLIAAIQKDPRSAKGHYQELLPFKGLVVAPYLGLAADHVLAVLASTSGEVSLAREHFESALSFCRTNGLFLELAYTCRDYGEFLLHTMSKIEKRTILELCGEASPIAASAGLVHLTETLEAIRRSLVHAKSRTYQYPDALSEREVDVLRLISRGLSNAQIGERLFISLHTVANHVQSILEKTGTANRTEAAAYAIRHNLTSDQGSIE